MDSVTALS